MSDLEEPLVTEGSEERHDRTRAEWLLGQTALWLRWLQLPFVLGLVVTLIFFGIVYFEYLFSILSEISGITKTEAILVALTMIDMALLANLLLIVGISGFKLFISPQNKRLQNHLPDWIKALTLANIKYRISATALMISTIHILHKILDPNIDSESEVIFVLTAQIVLMATTALFAAIDRAEARAPRPS